MPLCRDQRARVTVCAYARLRVCARVWSLCGACVYDRVCARVQPRARARTRVFSHLSRVLTPVCSHRSKLFAHIKETGHALYDPANPASVPKQMKGGKKKR